MPLSKTNTYILSEHYTACLHGDENDKLFKTHFQKFVDSGTLITVFTYTKGKRNDNLAILGLFLLLLWKRSLSKWQCVWSRVLQKG